LELTMSSKGFLALSLFIASVLVTHTVTMPPVIESSHSQVTAGETLTVKVTAAACYPVSVVVIIDGDREVRGTISEVPGEVGLPIPPGTTGQSYRIEVSCPNERSSESGTIM
jgi:hypothetical protein